MTNSRIFRWLFVIFFSYLLENMFSQVYFKVQLVVGSLLRDHIRAVLISGDALS